MKMHHFHIFMKSMVMFFIFAQMQFPVLGWIAVRG